MHFTPHTFKYFTGFWLGVLLLLCVFSCDSYLREAPKETVLAKLGEEYLYLKTVPSFLYENATAEDSIAIVNDYVNQWAAKQLLIQKALLNLPVSKIQEFDRLVENYKADLYTLAYKEALVRSRTNAEIDTAALKDFYEIEKKNFKLREKLIRLRFVMLPPSFQDIEPIKQSIVNFEDKDIRFLDSISIQFNKMNLNDSIWVPLANVIKEIAPLNTENEAVYLKKSQFFELKDSIGVYLGFVVGVLQVNDTAPLSYIKPSLEQVLKIRRKQDFLRQIERDIINEAIKNRHLEIYN